MSKIIWIEKGIGDESTFFTCGEMSSDKTRMDEIKEEWKEIADGVVYMIYVGYKNGEKVFEMYAGQNITVMYKIEEKTKQGDEK